MHQCSLLCLAVAQSVSSPAGSLYDSSIGLQRFPQRKCVPGSTQWSCSEGTSESKCQTECLTPFSPSQTFLMECTLYPSPSHSRWSRLLSCSSVSPPLWFSFLLPFFPLACCALYPGLCWGETLYHISLFKWDFIWEMGLYYEKLTLLFWNKGVWYRQIVSFRTQNFRKCEMPFF